MRLPDKLEFIRFLMESKVLNFGEFITKSGRRSPYFINMGDITTGEELASLGRFYGGCIVDNIAKGKIPSDINVLFGPAYKGIPLSVATAISLSKDYQINLNYCFNRKEQKDHGEGGSIVGHKLKDGDKVLIIEDVITAGTAVRECLPLLNSSAEIEICGLVVAVDRMEKGRGQLSAVEEMRVEHGIPTFSIVNIKEVFDLIPSMKNVGNEKEIDQIITGMNEYMDCYCCF
jgi:orotate phosphoribosyltransferase